VVASVLGEIDRLSHPGILALRQRAAAAEDSAARWRAAWEAEAATRAARDGDLATIRASTSWRVTAPLRAFGRLLRR
jgi:hypothetical protein